MFKSNLFSQLATTSHTPMWNVAEPEEPCPQAAMQMVENLVEHEEDNRQFLIEQISGLENGIDQINSGRLGREEQLDLVKRLSDSHDVYALARRMSMRLRVLIQTNERLSASASALQQRQATLLEQEILDWD